MPATLDTAPPADGDRELSLQIEGMSCGACAARVERSLNALEGVRARVNYAAERASVALGDGVPVQRLLDEVAAAGYGARLAGGGESAEAEQLERRVRSLRRRLLLAATLFMPLCDASVFLSIYPSARFAGWQWAMAALAAPVVGWAAWPFYEAAVRAARHRTTTMDTLVSIGILASTGWSLYSMFALDRSLHGAAALGLGSGSGGGIYLDVPAGVTTFLLAGRYFEAWSKRRAGNALRALAALAAREVCVLGEDGRERRQAIGDLRAGQRFVVRPGETVAADGEVVSGRSAIDQSLMTGESLPLDVGPGAAVLGGTVSLDGRIVVRAERVGPDAQLGHMMRLVERAQNQRAGVQRLADRICAVFVPAVLALAAATLAAWLALGNPAGAAFSAALSVLIIACPCALGLATPAALLAASWAGTRLGVFFKDYAALEASRQVDTVVFDKTGTLTQGRMAVVDCRPAPGVGERELLARAGAVERASEHPIARAIAAYAEDRCGALADVGEFEALPGLGARGVVEGERVYVGRPGAEHARVPAALAGACERWEAEGRTAVLAFGGGRALGALAIADALRPSAPAAVARLRGLGLRCMLVTGDNEATARAVAAAAGIEEVLAGALPVAKVEAIRRLQGEGRRVAMVGDGVNDAPALAVADLALAVGSGTEVAINAAELIVMREDLRTVATAIELARRTLWTIRANLAWAFLYNVVAIPLAAFGLLDPLIAGGAMALSSSFVVWNSSRLRRAVSGAGGEGVAGAPDGGTHGLRPGAGELSARARPRRPARAARRARARSR
ncbi:MAG TPA: cation-translocating P-type ATPase [Solirubrobacteraceae bacterium]|jgi:heavy metal translocating P-type ATPase|nr:cation-translocating P-type ATPase [Solirubrobacteraceae bacterium]